MAYTLKPTRTAFSGGKNILASEHVQFIEGGATLDATKFGAGLIEVGTLIVRNTTTGKFEPYADYTDTETGTTSFPPGYDEPAVLNVDVDCNGVDDVIVGEVIVRGSVYEAKLPVAPSEHFKAKAPMIRFVKEI